MFAMPHDLNTEKAVLGCLIQAADVRANGLLLLKEKYFHDILNQEVFKIIQRLHNENRFIAHNTVTNQLNDSDMSGVIREMCDYACYPSKLEGYILELKEFSAKRDLIEVRQIVDNMLEDNSIRSEQIIDKVEETIYSFRQTFASRGYRHITEGEDEYFKELLERNQAVLNGEEPEISETIPITLCSSLNHHFGNGLHPTNLIILAGRPAMGKSSLALELAIDLGERNIPVVIHSLEMSKRQLMLKYVANKVGVSVLEIMSGKYPEDKRKKMQKYWHKFKSTNLYIDDSGTQTVKQIRSNALKHFSQYEQKGVLITDYLNLVSGDGGKASDTRAKELSDIARQFKHMAMDLEIPVIGLAQIGRGVEQRQDKRPAMSDIKESGGMEEHANQVLAVYRDEYYNKDTADKNVCEVLFLKNRLAPEGTVKMYFDAESGRFGALANEWEIENAGY